MEDSKAMASPGIDTTVSPVKSPKISEAMPMQELKLTDSQFFENSIPLVPEAKANWFMLVRILCSVISLYTLLLFNVF